MDWWFSSPKNCFFSIVRRMLFSSFLLVFRLWRLHFWPRGQLPRSSEMGAERGTLFQWRFVDQKPPRAAFWKKASKNDGAANYRPSMASNLDMSIYIYIHGIMYLYIYIYMCVFEWCLNDYLRFHHPSRGSQLNSPHLGLESQRRATSACCQDTESVESESSPGMTKALGSTKGLPKIGLWNKITGPAFHSLICL